MVSTYNHGAGGGTFVFAAPAIELGAAGNATALAAWYSGELAL